MQHDLTHENTNPGIVLEYVHGEVSERLQGWRCAEQIETCIEHLKAELIQAKYTFPGNSNQYRFNNEFISTQKLLTLHSIASFDLQLGHTVNRHNQGSMLSWHRPASRPASRATVHGL
jgi:hypothetical protein